MGAWGSRPPDFGQRVVGRSQGGLQGVVGVVNGLWNIIISCHVQECLKEVTLKRNRIICPEVVVNDQFLPEKSKFVFKLPEKIKTFQKIAWKNRNFLKICLEKAKFFKNLPWKSKIFCEIAWKNRNFSEICLENRYFDDPDPRPPILKPDWRRCRHAYRSDRTVSSKIEISVRLNPQGLI